MTDRIRETWIILSDRLAAIRAAVEAEQVRLEFDASDQATIVPLRPKDQLPS